MLRSRATALSTSNVDSRSVTASLKLVQLVTQRLKVHAVSATFHVRNIRDKKDKTKHGSTTLKL